MSKTHPDFRALSAAERATQLESLGEKPFRARQIEDWLWKKGARSFDAMSSLSKDLRSQLQEQFSFPSLQVDVKQESKDDTIKVRFRTADDYFIEGVLIPTPHRLTACVSSQVGCSLTCAFCATGKMERKRNLRFDEIFDQVVMLNELSVQHFKKPLTNIVFMGMGEPLLNYSNVLKAIDYISSPNGLGMSPRRITVSTAGIAKMIRQLGEDKVRFNLAVSLHAANDKKRNEIMPINESNNLEALVESLDFYFAQTKNRISFEYILFKNFNDTEQDAKDLVKLCRRVPAKVNLIEYNTVKDVPFTKTEDSKAELFSDMLYKQNVTATIRHSRGKDIDAACGQLANK